MVVASVLFTTLQAFLPSSSSGRYIHAITSYSSCKADYQTCLYFFASVRVKGEAQSLVISSQVASVGKDGKMTNLMEDNPVIINFEFQLVCDMLLLNSCIRTCILVYMYMIHIAGEYGGQ